MVTLLREMKLPVTVHYIAMSPEEITPSLTPLEEDSVFSGSDDFFAQLSQPGMLAFAQRRFPASFTLMNIMCWIPILFFCFGTCFQIILILGPLHVRVHGPQEMVRGFLVDLFW